MKPADYGDTLTKEEENWGYQLLDVENPSDRESDCPIVKAVVYKLGQSDRIIKVVTVDGSCRYKHQRYGRIGTSIATPPDWLTVGDMAFATPAMAIRMIKPGHAEKLGRGSDLFASITAVDPGEDH